MNEKFEQEFLKLLELGKKKGSLPEEDILLRFLKYEATAKETNEIIEKLKLEGIKILPPMEEKFDVLEMFRALKKIKKQENFRIALMSKEELINYVVEQMEFVEQNFPDILMMSLSVVKIQMMVWIEDRG